MNNRCQRCGQEKIQLGHTDPDFDYYCPHCDWEAINEADFEHEDAEQLRRFEKGLLAESDYL